MNANNNRRRLTADELNSAIQRVESAARKLDARERDAILAGISSRFDQYKVSRAYRRAYAHKVRV